MANEHLDKWRFWYLENIGPRELPLVCKHYRIFPPGFRSLGKVPYQVLKSYFRKRVLANDDSSLFTTAATMQLRTNFPDLQKQLQSLPVPCTLADLQELDSELQLGDLALGLLLADREDLKEVSLQIMEQHLPFEKITDKRPVPAADYALQTENRRLARLVAELKKSLQLKQEKWQKETAKLRSEMTSLQKALTQEQKRIKEQEAGFEAKRKQDQELREAAERKARLMEGNHRKALERIAKLESQILEWKHRSESQEKTIRDLTEEVARLNRLLAIPVVIESQESGNLARPLPKRQEPLPTEPMVSLASEQRETSQREEPLHYHPVVKGILHIPVRSRFGLLATEQGIDLYVSEKIIYSIQAEDGDQLEGQLVGEYSPGIPQYRYRLLQKGAEPSSHRELLGIVEERAGWIGVRDLEDADLFIPLHAYELQHVTVGDVVTILFDVSHPHNNRIVTIHEHILPEERNAYRPKSRKVGRPDDGESPSEMKQTLQGMHFLICGAQSNMVTQYEEAISVRGGSVVVLESQPHSLQPYVAKADIVICNIHQITHPFYWLVKEEASRQKKSIRYPISGGVSAILREIETAAACLRGEDAEKHQRE